MATKKRAVSVDSTAPLKHNPFGALSRGQPSAQPPKAPSRDEPPQNAAPREPAAPRAQSSPPGLRLDRKLVLRRELKGRGGKTVTRIAGLPRDQLDTLATSLKKQLGCGAVVEGADLLLLGDLVDRAAALLEAAGARQVVKGN